MFEPTEHPMFYRVWDDATFLFYHPDREAKRRVDRPLSTTFGVRDSSTLRLRLITRNDKNIHLPYILTGGPAIFTGF